MRPAVQYWGGYLISCNTTIGTTNAITNATRANEKPREPLEDRVLFIVLSEERPQPVAKIRDDYRSVVRRGNRYVIVLEAPEERFVGLRENTIAAGLEPKAVLPHTEPDYEGENIVLTRYKRKALFSETLELPTASLRKWKPRISIDESLFESEDV